VRLLSYKFCGFKVQIDYRIIKNKDIDDKAFVLYCKLVQLYYKKGRAAGLEVNHQKLMKLVGENSNKKFKQSIKTLFDHKLLKKEITTLPKNSMFKIELNPYFDKQKRKEEKKKTLKYQFAQLPVELLDVRVLERIGHTGVRLLYYYTCYTNQKLKYAFPSYETIAEELGLSKTTIAKYNKILKKAKMLYIDKNEIEYIGYSEQNDDGVFEPQFTKYHNHYVVDVYNAIPLIIQQHSEV
jgi:hypothetical protein